MESRSKFWFTVATILLANVVVGSACAQSINFNFATSTGGGVTPADVLGAGETAGAPGFNSANWNNLRSDWSGTSGAIPSPIVDSTGATVTGLGLSYDAPNAWNNGIGTGTGDLKLMKNYLDSSGSDSPYVTISGVPYRKYDVVVYADGDQGAGGTDGPYVLRYGTGTTQAAQQTEAATNITNLVRAPVWLKETGNFSGTYTQVSTTSSLSVASAASGNYMVFSGLKGNITIDPTQTTSVSRAPLNGFQLVKWETTNAIPGADNAAAKVALYSGNATVAANRTIGSLATAVGTYGDLTIDPGVTLTLANGDLDVGDINHWIKGGGSITSSTNTLTIIRDISSGLGYATGATDAAINGVSLVNNGANPLNVVKTGGGMLRIYNSNPYTGTTTISQGTIDIGNSSSLGAGASTITINDAQTSFFNTGLLLRNGVVLARNINVANAGAGVSTTTLGTSEAGAQEISGSITLNKSIQVSTFAGSTLTLSNTISGSGNITKTGAGTLALTGANSYTGGTVVFGGVLSVSQIADSGTSNIGTAGGAGNYLALQDGTLRYTGAGSQSTARNLWVDQPQTASTFDITSATGELTFSGTGGNINKPIIKTGAGALTLADAINVGATVTVNQGLLTLTGANTYSGGTVVNSGILSVSQIADSGTSNIGTAGGAGNYLGLQNGTLRYTGTGAQSTARDLWVDQAQTASTFDITSATGALTFSGTGGNINKPIIKTGAGALTLADVINVGATVTVNQGTLKLTAENTYTGGTTVNGGILELSDPTNNGIGTIRGTLTVNATGTVKTTTANALGWGSGTKIDTLNIAGGLLDNTASGDQGWGVAINLTGGTLQSNGGVSSAATSQLFTLGGGSAINSLASSTTSAIAGRVYLREGNPGDVLPFDVADGAAATDLLVSAAITDGGAGRGIFKSGAGTMILSGDNTYTGTTTVAANSGELIVNGTTSGQGNYIINSGSRLGGDGIIGLASGSSVWISGLPGELSPGYAEIGTFSGESYSAGADINTVGTLEVGGDVDLGGSLLLDMRSDGQDLLKVLNNFELLNGPPNNAYLEINGTTDLTTIDFWNIFGWTTVGQSVDFVTFGSFGGGAFANVEFNEYFNDASGRQVMLSLDGNSISLVSTPEPASVAIWSTFGLALAALAVYRRRTAR